MFNIFLRNDNSKINLMEAKDRYILKITIILEDIPIKPVLTSFGFKCISN